MHIPIICITLALFVWLVCIISYFNIDRYGDSSYAIGNDTFLKFTLVQIFEFMIARFFLLKIKCKIVYDRGNYWIDIKYGFFKYHSVKFFASWAYDSYNSYGAAMEALKKYLQREITYGSTVKYKYKGDVIAEIRYHKGSR